MAQFKVGPWLINPDQNTVTGDNGESQLEPRTMEVLVHLMDNAERVVTPDELLENFWTGLVVEESTIHRRISQVRQVLEDDSRSPRYVRTIRKKGYQFIAPVVSIDATSGVQVDGAGVTGADIETSNGVIHVIDTVIMPKL